MELRNYIFILLISALFVPAFSYAQTRSIVFPVDGESTFRDDFLEPRGGGTRQHLGVDILADKHTPVVAAVDGVVSYIPLSEPSWGYMITIQDRDGYQYRYIHLNNDTPGTDDGQGGIQYAYASGLRRGSEVRAGQLIGWLGDSGNAENTVPHLHFEIRTPNRNAINPYQSLFSAASPQNFAREYVEHEHVDAGEAGVEEGAELIFTIELSEGMEGYAIEELQRRLQKAGHFTHPTRTRYFGPVTKAALQSFQNANNIAPTGVLGFETRALLNGDPIASSGRVRLEKELFEGDEDQAVLQVELKLETLGHFDGTPDIVFDSQTREAVRRFQNAEGLSPTGYVTYDTWNTLNDRYKVAPKPTLATTQTSGATAITSTETLSIGSRGSDVVLLQDRLRELGHFSPNIISTGYFGPVTHEAVISFQEANSIETIGIVGPKTRAALNTLNTTSETVLEEPSNSTASFVFTTTLDIGSRGNEVVELQCLLRDLGFFDQNTLCTGYFGPITHKAVADFQVSKGIEAIGIVGPQTRTALNSL